MIDAHQHFWRIGHNAHSWPTADLAAIHRDFGPADLRAAAGPALDGSVVVQSQPSDRDTDWLIDLSAETPLILGVVGWADLEAASAPDRIAALASRAKVRGLRPMLQSLPQDDWIEKAALGPAVEAMLAHGLSLDALVLTRHLPHLHAFARRWPDLPIVIDHAAKPPIAAGEAQAVSRWRDQIAALAALPNLWCKLSGLLTEAAPGQGEAALAPYVDHLLAVFGAQRLMWGSDWPVVNLAGDYGGWLATAQGLTAVLSPPEADALFSRTAQRFYRL